MADHAGVVVLGPSRSGTSAVAGMFVEAGFFAGRDEDILPATADNPRGHHENVGVLRSNERVLSQLGGRWAYPPPVAVQLRAAGWARPAFEREIERLRREVARG